MNNKDNKARSALETFEQITATAGLLQELTNRVAAGELTAAEAFELLVRAQKTEK